MGRSSGVGTESIRVLLVEDSEDDALLLLRELRRGGYKPISKRVYTARDMEAALDEGEWDLVISDHSMPSFSAPAALELLHRKGSWDLPFIIVSGKIGENAAVEAMRAGAHDYVMKDNMARLNTAIERELREAEVRRERRRAEQRFKMMFEQSPLGIAIGSPDGRWLQINRSLEEIWGATLEQILEHDPDYNALGDEVLEDLGIMPYIERGFSGEATAIPPVPYSPLPAARGDRRWVRSFIYPVKDLTGEIREVVLMQEDITERKEAEEKYRSIFENAVEGIFQSTEEGDLLTANPAMARMLGYDSVEELLATVSDVGSQHYAESEQREEFRRLMQEHNSVSGFEMKLRRRDGGTVWVSVAARVVRDRETVVYEGTMEDITARKQAEELLRQSEALYRTVVEQAVENIFFVDVQTKRIVEANPAFLRSLGYTAEELRHMTLYDIVAHDRESVDENVRLILQRGRHSIGERRYRRKDGSFAEVEVGVSVISYGGRDAMCVVAHDVTDRKRVLESLRQSEERYRAVVEQTAEGLFLFDAETKRLLETNAAFQRLLGYSARELEQASLYDIVVDDRESVDRNIRLTLEGGHALIGERRYRRKDGGTVDVEVSGSVISYGGRRIISALARDITERKRAEEAQREIREAERRRISRDLHDGVLQDLSYTLQSMQIERTLSGGVSEERDRQIEALRRSVGGLRDAIYDLRLETTRKHKLVHTLESLVSIHRRMEPERRIELSVAESFPESLSGQVASEMARIVQEALVNVRRHSGARHVTVALDTTEEEALLTVEDDGRGFEQEAQPGIGLTSMRERALALGGKLEVNSKENEGTRVRLRVPLAVLPDGAAEHRD